MNTKTKIKEPFHLKMIRWSYPRLERVTPGIAHTIAWTLFFSPFRFKRPLKEQKAFESASISSIKVNKKEVKIFEWGVKENPVIAIVHGWSGRATQFQAFIPLLVEAGYHVVGFDAPAHGLSEGKSTNIKEFYEVLVHINRTIGKIKIGIGHSFGGVSLLYSKKEGLKIDTVIMISSPTIGNDILSGFRKKINASQETDTAIRSMVKSRFSLNFEDITACELIKKVSLKNHLIIHDKNDVEVPVNNAIELHQLNPDSELLLTEKLGHTRILRDTIVVKSTLNFLDNL